jgi:hypothetical protein
MIIIRDLFVPSKIGNMKKLTNCISPFIMLLVPLFLLIGILALSVNNEIPVEKQNASLKLQVPSVKTIIQAVIK